MSEVQLVLATAPSSEVAESIVAELVRERLIACGSISTPITSIFRWQGNIERSAEVLVIIKTLADLVPRVIARIGELHPYDVPEILALPLAAGHQPYLEWVRESVANHND